MLGVLRVAGPFIADADPAGEPHQAVDHQQLAVRPVVEPPQVVPVQRPILLHVDPRILELLQLRFLHLEAAGPVEQDFHLHSGAGAFA